MAAEGEQPAAAPPRRRSRRLVAVALAGVVAVTGWLGWRDVHLRRADAVRGQMVQAARDGMLALTAVDYEQVDLGVQRILDASTGAFRDDFAQRADSFKDAARRAQSKSVGTVTETGVESVDGDGAGGGAGRVLVALTVMTTNRGVPERQPKSWRTRVTVEKTDDVFKVAAVEFVP